MKTFILLLLTLPFWSCAKEDSPARSQSAETLVFTPADPCPYSPFMIVFDNGLENYCGHSLIEFKFGNTWYYVTDGTPYNGRIVYSMWTEDITQFEFRGTWKKDQGCSGGTVKIEESLTVNQNCL